MPRSLPRSIRAAGGIRHRCRGASRCAHRALSTRNCSERGFGTPIASTTARFHLLGDPREHLGRVGQVLEHVPQRDHASRRRAGDRLQRAVAADRVDPLALAQVTAATLAHLDRADLKAGLLSGRQRTPRFRRRSRSDVPARCEPAADRRDRSGLHPRRGSVLPGRLSIGVEAGSSHRRSSARDRHGGSTRKTVPHSGSVRRRTAHESSHGCDPRRRTSRLPGPPQNGQWAVRRVPAGHVECACRRMIG